MKTTTVTLALLAAIVELSNGNSLREQVMDTIGSVRYLVLSEDHQRSACQARMKDWPAMEGVRYPCGQSEGIHHLGEASSGTCIGVRKYDGGGALNDKSVFSCFKANGDWKRRGGGASVSITASTTASRGISESEARSMSLSVSVTAGFSAFGASLSTTASTSISTTTTTTITNTFSRTNSITHSVNCENGQVFQWVTTISPRFASSPTVTVDEPQFVCVPNNINAAPKCPPGFCANTNKNGDNPGCQCCNSASWAEDQSRGNACSQGGRSWFG